MLDYDLLPARAKAAPGKGWACLVLHGLGDTKSGWKPVAQVLGIDRLTWIFANAPNPYYDGGSWFDLLSGFVPDADGVRASRAALTELIAHLRDRLAIGCERLFLLGFSQGALMVIDSALRAEGRFAGVIGISGFMTLLEEYPASLGASAREQEFLLTHGLHDPMIPIHLVREQKDRLVKLGCRVEWREYRKDHSIDPEEELPMLKQWISRRMV